MKKFIVSLALLSAAFVSCNKDESAKVPEETGLTEISFGTDGLFFETKATPVTALTSFNVVATTGAAGSEVNAWSGTATQSGSDYNTGRYWPATNPSYHFYGANTGLTFAAAGCTVSPADANTDIICAYLPSPTYNSKNTMAFNHIFARVGTIILSTVTGYELSAVSCSITNGVTSGTYNLRTGAWSGLGAASARATAAFTGTTAAQSSSNDIWLVPGTYTFSITYTLTKGAFTDTVTKTGSATIVAGKVNNISATAVADGEAVEIQFNVNIAPWSNQNLSMGLS